MFWKLEPRKISKYMEPDPSYLMGLLPQTVWGLIGTQYQGYPMNVGRSNTINIFGARRKATSSLWLIVPSITLIHFLVKAITLTPSPLSTIVKLVILHLPSLNVKSRTIKSRLSVPSPINFQKLFDWFRECTVFHTLKRRKILPPQEYSLHLLKKKYFPLLRS